MDARDVLGYRNIFREIPYCTRYMVFGKGKGSQLEKDQGVVKGTWGVLKELRRVNPVRQMNDGAHYR